MNDPDGPAAPFMASRRTQDVAWGAMNAAGETNGETGGETGQ